MSSVMSPMLLSADVSGRTQGSKEISTAQREKRLLHGLIQNLLPAVGTSVKSIILAYSSTVSSKMVGRAAGAASGCYEDHFQSGFHFLSWFLSQVRQILSLCPNITHLDLTQTDVTDFAFER